MIKLIKCTIICFLSILIFACKDKKVKLENCDQIKLLEVINKTGNQFIPKSIVINDRSSIAEFCNIIYNRSYYGDAKTKSNFGYYHIKVFFNDGTKSSYDILYTVYDGIIIIDPTSKHYKNDEIDNYILYQFQKGSK